MKIIGDFVAATLETSTAKYATLIQLKFSYFELILVLADPDTVLAPTCP